MTKWAEAIPIPDQTAEQITKELIKVFSRFGIPDVLHSDQGKILKVLFFATPLMLLE